MDEGLLRRFEARYRAGLWIRLSWEELQELTAEIRRLRARIAELEEHVAEVETENTRLWKAQGQ